MRDDICANNHGGDLASNLAFEKARHTRQFMYDTLTDLFMAHGNLTSNEIADLLGLPNRNQFAPRISEMRRAGAVTTTGELRDGCNVLRLVMEP